MANPVTKNGMIVVTGIVFNGLKAVRKSGMLANPNQYRIAARIASSCSYDEAARWILRHPEQYLVGIKRGFTANGDVLLGLSRNPA